MGIVKLENVRGCTADDGRVLCVECMDTENVWDDIKESSLILEEQTDDAETFYFCDSCEKQLG